MRRAPLMITGLLCIGFLAWYCWSVEHPGRSGVPGEGLGEPLFTFGARDVTTVILEGNRRVVLEKKGALWRITDPVQTAADQEEAELLVLALTRLHVRETINEPGELSLYGLEEPSLTFRIQTPAGERSLFVGSLSPTSSFAYVRVDGRPEIFLIPSREKACLEKDLLSLRDRRLVAMDQEEIHRVRITRGAMILEFIKDRAGLWQCTGDDTRKLDQDIIQEFVRRACGTRARAYPDGPPDAGAPDVSLVLYSGGDMQALDLWGRTGRKGTVSASSDYQGCPVRVDSSILEVIPDNIEQVLERGVVNLQGREVTRVTLRGQKVLDIHKQGGIWFSGSHRIDDDSSVNAFLDCLGRLEYTDQYLALPEEIGQAQHIAIYCDPFPVFDITVYSQYYMTVGERIYRISEEDMQDFRVSLDMLLKRTPLRGR